MLFLECQIAAVLAFCIVGRVQDLESSGLAGGPNPLMRRTNSGRRTAAAAAAAIEEAEAAVRRCEPFLVFMACRYSPSAIHLQPLLAGK